jgi:hypothetical protein
LKKVWSLVHHCTKPADILATLAISCCMRTTHAAQSASAPCVARRKTTPVFISACTPHALRSFSAPSFVVSTETITSANANSAEVSAWPRTHGRGSASQITSRSEHSTSKPCGDV